MGVGQAPRRSGHRPWESLDRCWAVFTTSSGTTAACVYLAGLYRPPEILPVDDKPPLTA